MDNRIHRDIIVAASSASPRLEAAARGVAREKVGGLRVWWNFDGGRRVGSTR